MRNIAKLFDEFKNNNNILCYTMLLIFGGCSAYLLIDSIYYLSGNEPYYSYMPTRVRSLGAILNNIKLGNPLFSSFFADHNASYYIYLAYIGDLLGIYNAPEIFLLVQMVMMGFLLTVYPCFIYYISNSIFLSCASPFIIFKMFSALLFAFKTDSYWILGFVIVFSLPVLAVLYCRKWDNTSWLIIIFLSLFIGISNLPRVHAGLGIFILLIITIFLKTRHKISYFTIALLICLFNYSLFTVAIPYAYSNVSKQPAEVVQMGPWHTLYIGLGWEENKYGIVYMDEYAMGKVKEIHPDYEYLSNDYMQTLKTLYFKTLMDDPVYFIKSYVKKFIYSCAYFPLKIYQKINNPLIFTFLFMISAIFLYSFRYFLKLSNSPTKAKYLYLLYSSLFCYLFYTIFAIIAIPDIYYLLGTLSAGMFLVFIVILFVTEAFLGINGNKYFNNGNYKK